MEGLLVVLALVVLSILQNVSRAGRDADGQEDASDPEPGAASPGRVRQVDPGDVAADAERLRREAYAAIREMLGGGGGTGEEPARPAGNAPVGVPGDAPMPHAPPVPVEARAPREPRAPRKARAPHVSRVSRESRAPRKDRVPREKRVPQEVRGRRARREAVPPPPRRAPSGLARLEQLPPLRRAILHAELLGPPVALREDGPPAR
ncbi:MAG: hypothetical protein RRA92_02285 [Gemmatimonadota bacterium]|nr:hypothetical protein [Gemmatimonadota bacterium]